MTDPRDYILDETDFYPASVPCETTILGSVLLNCNIFADVRQKLNLSDFSLDSHQRIFRAMGFLPSRSSGPGD